MSYCKGGELRDRGIKEPRQHWMIVVTDLWCKLRQPDSRQALRTTPYNATDASPPRGHRIDHQIQLVSPETYKGIWLVVATWARFRSPKLPNNKLQFFSKPFVSFTFSLFVLISESLTRSSFFINLPNTLHIVLSTRYKGSRNVCWMNSEGR